MVRSRNKTHLPAIDCPVERAIEVIGDRWTALIVRDLFQKGACRFQDLSDSLDGISPAVLSGRLKKLVDFDIVRMELYSEHPPRNHYVLTEKGHDLGPLLGSLRDWGEMHTRS